MRKVMQWMMAAILICGLGVFTSCTNDDNPVGGDMINPMPTESDLIGVWKVTNVKKGSYIIETESINEGDILEIKTNHKANYYNSVFQRLYEGDWSLNGFDYEAFLGDSQDYYQFWFQMSLIKGEDNKIEVKGKLYFFEVEIGFNEEVQFILERYGNDENGTVPERQDVTAFDDLEYFQEYFVNVDSLGLPRESSIG